MGSDRHLSLVVAWTAACRSVPDMARPLRIENPGAIYPVGSRGNPRQAIVADERDRERRVDWLRRGVEEHGWRVNAFVLMTNHEHRLVETPEPNLSRGMKLLNGAYTQGTRWDAMGSDRKLSAMVARTMACR